LIRAALSGADTRLRNDSVAEHLRARVILAERWDPRPGFRAVE
jgi:hypothetical protein